MEHALERLGPCEDQSVTERLPLKERLTYASLYAAIDNWRQFITKESQNSRKLTDFLATADQPENRRQIRLYLIEARFMLYRRRLNYDYFLKRFDELGIKPDTTSLLSTSTQTGCAIRSRPDPLTSTFRPIVKIPARPVIWRDDWRYLRAPELASTAIAAEGNAKSVGSLR